MPPSRIPAVLPPSVVERDAAARAASPGEVPRKKLTNPDPAFLLNAIAHYYPLPDSDPQQKP